MTGLSLATHKGEADVITGPKRVSEAGLSPHINTLSLHLLPGNNEFTKQMPSIAEASRRRLGG